MVVSMLKSCTGWINICGRFGASCTDCCIRVITSLMLSRSPLGFKVICILPLLSAGFTPSAPTNEAILSTAGSCINCSTKSCCILAIAG